MLADVPDEGLAAAPLRLYEKPFFGAWGASAEVDAATTAEGTSLMDAGKGAPPAVGRNGCVVAVGICANAEVDPAAVNRR